MISLRRSILSSLLLLLVPQANATEFTDFSYDMVFSVNSLEDLTDAERDRVCSSGASGVCTLRAALQEAAYVYENNLADNIGIRIDVAGEITLDVDTSSDVDEDAALIGDLDIAANVVIAGHADGTTIKGVNFGRLFDIPSGGIDPYVVTLLNLTIDSGGSATDGGLIQNKGDLTLDNVEIVNGASTHSSVFNDYGQLTIIDSLFQGNRRAIQSSGGFVDIGGNSRFVENVSRRGGSALLITSGSAQIEDTVFENNGSDLIEGGAILLKSGTLLLSDSSFRGNQAKGGGAIYSSGTILAQNVDFSQNRSSLGNGGAIHLTSGSAVFTQTTFNQNESIVPFAKSGIACGGAAYIAAQAAVTFSEVEMTENIGASGGGAVCSEARSDSDNIKITDSWLGNNRADDTSQDDEELFGGAILSAGGVVVERSLINENSATFGAAIFVEGDNNSVSDSTIADNTAAGSAGAVYFRSANDSFSLISSTLSNNESGSGGANHLMSEAGNIILKGVLIDDGEGDVVDCGSDPKSSGYIVSSGYNIDRDRTCGLNQESDQPELADIGLSALADNGGDYPSVALTGTTNPAFNKLPAAECSARDVRGFKRAAGDCDIGAYDSSATEIPESVIAFAVSRVSAQEAVSDNNTVVLNVIRTGDLTEEVSVQLIDLEAGTAAVGQDYEVTGNTVAVFSPGEAEEQFTIKILDDLVKETSTFESAFFTISPANGTPVIGTNNTIELQIFDNDSIARGEFRLGASSYSSPELIRDDTKDTVTEGETASQYTTLDVSIVRSKGSQGEVTFQFETEDGTATAGKDYIAQDGDVTFEDGETLKIIQFSIINDLDVEDDETFTLRIYKDADNKEANFGSPVEAEITITSEDVTPDPISLPEIDRKRSATGAMHPSFLLLVLGVAGVFRRKFSIDV